MPFINNKREMSRSFNHIPTGLSLILRPGVSEVTPALYATFKPQIDKDIMLEVVQKMNDITAPRLEKVTPKQEPKSKTPEKCWKQLKRRLSLRKMMLLINRLPNGYGLLAKGSAGERFCFVA